MNLALGGMRRSHRRSGVRLVGCPPVALTASQLGERRVGPQLQPLATVCALTSMGASVYLIERSADELPWHPEVRAAGGVGLATSVAVSGDSDPLPLRAAWNSNSRQAVVTWWPARPTPSPTTVHDGERGHDDNRRFAARDGRRHDGHVGSHLRRAVRGDLPSSPAFGADPGGVNFPRRPRAPNNDRRVNLQAHARAQSRRHVAWRPEPVRQGQPGIQLVPASGIFAMAAASMVRATRSSGSRWWTSLFPHARASVVSSIVIARR